MNNDCIFCKIISGEIAATVVYENEHVYSFLDNSPVNIGHTLVLPKKHYTNLYETPDEIIADMMIATKKVGSALKKSLVADGINVHMNNDAAAGQAVFHAHVHVIPHYENDGFLNWKHGRGYTEGEKEETVEKIKNKL